MSTIIPIHFRTLALSHQNPVARAALYFWQASSARRQAIAKGERPNIRADLTLHQLAESAPRPVATRAADLLAAAVTSLEPSQPSQTGGCA